MKTKLLYLLCLLFVGNAFSQSWTSMGVTEFTDDVSDLALTHDDNNAPYIAYISDTDNKLYVKKHDGVNWVNVGGAVSSETSLRLPTITIYSTTGYPWVAYVNAANKIDVYEYNGTNWIAYGTGGGNIVPEVKLMLKVSAAGQAVVATQSVYTSGVKKLVIYKCQYGTWVTGFEQAIHTGSFQLLTDIRVAYIKGYLKLYNGNTYYNNLQFNIASYYSSSNIWQSSYAEEVLNSTTDIFSKGLATTNQGDKMIYNYYEYGNLNQEIQYNGGSSVLGSSNASNGILSLKYSSVSENYYAMFLDDTNTLLVQKYIPGSDTWRATSINTGATSVAKMNCSPSGTKLHVAYIDANNKVAVKEYLPVIPPTIYVDADATGNNDGTTWADAYTTLDDAITTADFPSEIWVADGVYTPNTGVGRAATFLINKKLTIYGGFNGTETNLSDRDPLNNVTVLSGDLNGDDTATITETETSRQDNAYHVVTLKGNIASGGGVIDGFTISGGNANGPTNNSCSTATISQYYHLRGGAIYVNPDATGREISMDFNNCIIEKNSATGMAVYVTYNPCGVRGTDTTIDFENCIIRDNYSVSNSALFYGGSGTYSNNRYGSLINCLLYNNHCVNDASVITLSTAGGVTSSKVNIINTTIAKNTSGVSKVIKMNNASNSKIQNSIIYDNESATSIDLSAGAQSSINNSIVEGGQLGGSSSNPLFTDAANNDFTLQSTSTSIDTGNNSYVPTITIEDLLGNQRIFNTTVDMGPYEFGSSSLGIGDFKFNENDIKLFPNPTSSILNIKMKTSLKNASILNLQGQKVIESKSTQLDVSKLSLGMYIIEIEDENGSLISKRFIKQ